MLAKVKEAVQHTLIRGLGFDRYLFSTSLYRIGTIPALRYQKDFIFFTKMVPQDCVMLDIGANIGVTTYFLKKQNPGCALHSFEPIPDNFKNLEKVVSHFKLERVTLHPCGLGDKSGQLSMVMPVIHGVKRHALCHVVEAGAPEEPGVRFTVPILRLDDIPALKDRTDVKAIKIDVENFEHAVFLGGLGLISRCRPVIFCELWDSDNKTKVLELFRGMDYDIKLFDGRDSLRGANAGHLGSGNYFLIPKEWPGAEEKR